MYPTIVVVLVHHKNSAEETYGVSSFMATRGNAIRDVEATLGHLSFAVPLSMIRSAGTEVMDLRANAVEGERSKIESYENDSVVEVMEKGQVWKKYRVRNAGGVLDDVSGVRAAHDGSKT